MTIRTTAPTPLTIRGAALADVPVVASTLARAFQDDPVFTWCLPDAERRAAVLPSFFTLAAAAVLAHDETEIGDDGAAVALWVPPGRPAVSDDDAPSFEADVADLFGDDGERCFAIMGLLDEHHPVAAHRFLWFLGVRPADQGAGRGSALLRSMLTRCDRAGTAAYLDATSEHNRRLYERHGFEVLAGRSVAGSPPLWAMWRDPRRVA